MSDDLDTEWSTQRRQRIGGQFSFLGRIGFFIQLLLLVFPILFAAYVIFLRRAGQAGAKDIDISNYVSFASSLVMIFTTYWFYHYIRFGERIRSPEGYPPQSAVVSTLWVGFWAGWLGIILSMLLLLAAAWRMLFVLLANPQSGMLLAPTLGTNPGYSISAIDAISLTSLVVSLGAELVVLGLTLWLLFKMTWPSATSAKVRAALPA